MTLSGGSVFSGESPMIGRGVVKNAVGQSENLTGSLWSATSGVTSAYAGAKPTGVGAMTTLTENGTGLPFFTQSLPYFVRGPVIVSGYATSVAGSGWMAVSLDGGANLGWFNIGGGVAGAPGGRASVQVEATNVSGVYRWSYYTTNPNLLTLRLYVVNGNAVVTHTLGDAIAIGGVQIEECYPSQATPSPYVPTGAAPLSVYGSREWRQNHLAYSDNLTKWPYQNGTATITPTTISGASADFLLRQLAPNGVGTLLGSVFRYELDIMADAPCTVPVLIADAGDGTPTVQSNLPVTTSWTRWAVSMTVASPGAGVIGVYLGNGSTFPTGRTIYIRRASLTQGTSSPDFIPTNGASANSSGAPRSKVT
jgi:hypothetical protein